MATSGNTRKSNTNSRGRSSSSNRSTSSRSNSTRGNSRTTNQGTRKNTTRATSTKANTATTVRDQDAELKRNIIFGGMFIVCVAIFCCMIGVIGGVVGPFVKSLFLGVFGTLGFVMPFLIFIGYWLIAINKNSAKSMLKIILGFVFVFSVGIFLALVKRDPASTDMVINATDKAKMLYDFQTGGGVIFGFIAILMQSAFSKAGAIVLDIILALLTIALLSGKSVIEIFGSFFDKAINGMDDYYEEPDGQKRLELKGNVLQSLVDKKYIEEKENNAKEGSVELPPALIEEKNLDNADIIISEKDAEAKRLERLEKKEQEKRKREEEKRLQKERQEDERIVNASRKKNESLNLNEEYIKAKSSPSKDDMHEITLRSDEDILSSNDDNIRVMPRNITGSGNITEITDLNAKDNGQSANVNVYAEASEEMLKNRMKNSSFREDAANNSEANTTVNEVNNPVASKQDIIEIKPAEPEIIEASEEEYEPVANDNQELDSVEQIVTEPENNDQHQAEEKKVVSNESVYVPKPNDTPMEFDGGFVPIGPTSNSEPMDIVTSVALSKMPDPVTERTHDKINALAPEAPKIRKIVHKRSDYKPPKVDLLKKNEKNNKIDTDRELKETALKLQECLKTFGVAVSVSDISQGPSVTRYELTLGEGVKVNKILSLQDDIKLNLAAQDIRIEAPIPGKAAVGIEIPNKETSDVLIRDLIESREFKDSESRLSFAVGKDISGKTIVSDIAKMPHMLIAGSTGSGKSVCINTLIMSILYKAHPDDVKLIMIDPKVVELSVYNGIPHLMIPVVTDPKKASAALAWAVAEMTNRYNSFATYGVRDLKGYNEKVNEERKTNEEAPEALPQIIVIVDELADLMMVASKEVEESICRLAQLARAAGIHLIIATQRPSVDVITGLIKANMPSRVAFRVSSGIDSRTILDMVGAERLLGKGDMLFYPQGYPKPLRVQGAFVSDKEVSNVTDYLRDNNKTYNTDEAVSEAIANISSGGSANANAASDGKGAEVDEYFKEACKLVVERGSASSGNLQRVYRIGFNRAARMIDQMEAAGVVGKEQGTKPREVLVTMEQLEELLKNY